MGVQVQLKISVIWINWLKYILGHYFHSDDRLQLKLKCAHGTPEPRKNPNQTHHTYAIIYLGVLCRHVWVHGAS